MARKTCQKTNDEAGNQMKLFLQKMAAKYNGHFQTEQEQRVDAFDKYIQDSIAADPDRARLLQLAQSNTQLPLQSAFPIEEFLEGRFEYLTSGSFGSAMLHQRGRRRTPLAVKIINCLPASVCHQVHRTGMRYRDIDREVRCMRTLMQLARGVRGVIAEPTQGDDMTQAMETEEEEESTTGKDAGLVGDSPKRLRSTASAAIRHYKANCYPQLHALYLCDPSHAVMSFEPFFACTPGVSTYRAFEKAVLVMEHCGTSLHSKLSDHRFLSHQAVSVVKQVVLGLVTAERAFHFEHRDLHVSNLMVAPTKASTITFVAGNTRYSLPTHGVESKIIDFSYARLETTEGETLYKDLRALFSDHPGEIDPNSPNLFDGYRDMYNARGGKDVGWKSYSPGSNLAWVKRFTSEMLEQMARTRSIRNEALEKEETRRARFELRAEAVHNYLNTMLQLATHCVTTENFLQELLSPKFNKPDMVPIKAI